MRTPDYSPLDDALDAIAPHGITLANGNFNHAPMVAEALCALGFPEAVQPWLAEYRPRMQPRPLTARRIDNNDWRDALGQRERFADWALFFANELEGAAWPAVIDCWTARLAPGFCAAATHGVIRVGHAVHGLSEHETPSRRRELADALASWAASWQRLPEGDTRRVEPMPLREAIGRVPIVPPELRRRGNITAALAVLGEFPPFFPVIGWLGVDGPIRPLIAELTELFARVYLANAHDIPTTIAFIHAVTSPTALGNIAPHISDATADTLLRYAWQSCCALFACYGRGPAFAEDVQPSAKDEDELAQQAVAHGDEHVIKFTEACLGRHSIAASAAYLAAANHVAEAIPRRRPG
jgi:hypothetical protein